MHTYAQINSEGVCIADSDLHAEVNLPSMIAVDPMGRPYLGRRWSNGSWGSAQALPQIVVTAIRAGAHDDHTRMSADLSEVDTPVGATLEITAELRMDGQKLPLSDVFRMPVTSTDGRERVVLATMTNGIITMRIAMTESRTWQVTQDTINRALPKEKHMAFSGLTVYVIEE